MHGSHICVMAQGEIAFARPDGTRNVYDVIPAGMLWDTGKLLRDVAGTFGDNDTGLLLVPTMPGDGGDPEGTSVEYRWSCMIASAASAGFDYGSKEAALSGMDTGWITFRHVGRTIIMGVLDMIDQSRTPLFKVGADATTILDKIDRYYQVTGVLWRMTAGVTGCTSIRADRAARTLVQPCLMHGPETVCPGCPPKPAEPHWRWDKAPEGVHGAGFTIWQRELCPAERHGKIATFDIRAQYLAAMSAANQGWGEPSRKISAPFDPERAGFWQIAAKPLLALDGPPIVKNIDERGLTWVTTPIMIYLDSLGIRPLTYDSYTTATAGQLLRPWATKIRNGLYNDAYVDLTPALKRTYTETNGMFTVPGGSIYRPDWHWTNVDTAAMNARRKVDRVKAIIGLWPVRVYHDAVSYPVADNDAYKALLGPLGCGEQKIGKFRYASMCSVEEWEDKMSKGSKVNG